MRRILGPLATVMVLVVLAAACGDDSTATTDPSDEAPIIVSMSPTATETLFAIGAGDLVVAVDDQSTYPPEAPLTDLSGFGPSVESIAAYEPDLVVMWFDPGDVRAGLEALGVEVLFQPAPVTMSDVYGQIEELGAATGRSAEAAELVAEMQTRFDELVADAPAPETPVSYYHEVDNTYYTVTSATFYGELYGLFGLDNVADPADADGSAFGYPQLSEEFIIDADPDLIFLADVEFGENAATVAARPGWGTLSAVRNGGVVELDGEIAGRWGPRLVDYAETIAAALAAVVPA
jgi:iron complex transport system substrate-binding protein